MARLSVHREFFSSPSKLALINISAADIGPMSYPINLQDSNGTTQKHQSDCAAINILFCPAVLFVLLLKHNSCDGSLPVAYDVNIYTSLLLVRDIQDSRTKQHSLCPAIAFAALTGPTPVL